MFDICENHWSFLGMFGAIQTLFHAARGVDLSMTECDTEGLAALFLCHAQR